MNLVSVKNKINESVLIDNIFKFVIILLSLLVIFFIKNNFFNIPMLIGNIISYFIILAIAVVVILFGCKIKSKEIPCDILRSFCNCVALGLAFFLIVEPTTYISAEPENEIIVRALRAGDIVAIIFALIALRRPVFLILPGVHIYAARSFVETVSGFPMSTHDISYLYDAGIIFSIGIVVIHYLDKNQRCPKDKINIAYQALAYLIIGIHLANYFWSGVAKIMLDGGYLEWVLYNDISQMFLTAAYRGVAPLGTPPELAQLSYNILSISRLPLNIFTLILQLLSIVFVFRILWLRFSAVLFDLFHIGVYIVSGILFWPWIWMNVATLISTRKRKDSEIYFDSKLVAVSAILIGGTGVFHTAFLAWYDVADTRLVTIEAKMDNSQEWIPVPNSYTGSHSYTVSHGKLDLGIHDGHYPPNVAGLSYKASERRANGSCIIPAVDLDKIENEEEKNIRLNKFDNFIKAVHKNALEDQQKYGKYHHYFRLHHHPSNPFLYKEFNKINPEDILYFRLVTRSLCLKIVNGIIEANILKEDKHAVKVK